MEIRHLRYFVAVADTLSFAKAAQQLHMSQPPLSQRVADLEHELGIRLFDRSTRKVSLTPAAAAFLPEARAAVQAFDAAVRAMRAASATESRQLRVALPTETSSSVLEGVVSELSRDGIDVQLVEASTSEQQRQLGAGEIDVGVLRHPFDTQGLRVLAPLAQPLGVLMSSAHPLAERTTLRLQDLQSSPLVLFERHWSPGFYDEILASCRRGGYLPSRILHGIRLTAALLSGQLAVTFTIERHLKRRGKSGSGEFVWLHLEGEPIHVWTSVACRLADRSEVTDRAIAKIHATLQEREHWIPMSRPETDTPSPARRRSGG